MSEASTGSPAAETDANLVLRGGAWAAVSRVLPQLYVFFISIPAARFLGPEALGRQSFISFAQISVILLVTSGISAGLIRYVGQALGTGSTGAVRRLMRFVWAVEFVAALVGGSILVGAGALGAEPQGAWVFAGVACSIGVLHSVPSALLIGAQQWRSASIVGLVTGAFSAAAIVVVLVAGGGITEMFVVEAIVAAVNLSWTSALARRALASIDPGAETSPIEWDQLRADLLRFAALTSYAVVLTLVIWRRSEFIFLERYSTETDLAMYSIVFAFVAALGQIPEAAAAVTFPAVATLSGAGHDDRIAAGFATALRLLLLVSLPITAAILALGPRLLQVIYGEEYAGTGPVLLVMMAAFPLVPILFVSRSLLAGLGRLRFSLAAETVAAVVNIALAFVLVPRHGAVGAAGANVSAQSIAALLIVGYAIWLVRPTGWRPFALLRAVVASILAGLVAWVGVVAFGGGLGLLIGMAAGLIAFAVLAIVLRVLPAEDAAWLEAQAGASLGGRTRWMIRRLA